MARSYASICISRFVFHPNAASSSFVLALFCFLNSCCSAHAASIAATCPLVSNAFKSRAATSLPSRSSSSRPCKRPTICIPSSFGIKKQRELLAHAVLATSSLDYLALVVFFAAVFFAAGFVAAPSAAGFLLPFAFKQPRSCVAVKPCCLHNFFTVSKSASFDAASSFVLSSASAFSCAAISSSRCCGVVILSPKRIKCRVNNCPS